MAHLYPYVAKGVLLKTKSEFEGAVVKGVDQAFPWQKLSPYLIEGKFPVFDSLISKEIVLSKTLAQKLKLELGDVSIAYFQNDDPGSVPRIRYFNVAAIYQTGFPDFDNSFTFVDMRQLQKINGWTDQQIGGEIFLTPQAERSLMQKKFIPNCLRILMYKGSINCIKVFLIGLLFLILMF